MIPHGLKLWFTYKEHPMSRPRILSPSEIPLLDLEDVRSSDPSRRAAYFRDLERSLRVHGFLVVAGHGVDLTLLDRCYEVSRRFFAQPADAKRALLYSDIDQRSFSNIGYFPVKSEQAVGSSLADTKEFFHVGPSLPPDHPMRAHYADNVWPDVDGFRGSFSALFDQLQACGDGLFFSIAEHHGMDSDYARPLVSAGSHVLRTIHYPPVAPSGDAVWAAQHTGIQLLGLQPRTSHPGLEIALPSGEWVAPVEGFEDYFIINVGEMLAYLLGGRYRPTLHRVVSRYAGEAPMAEDRYAIVFFYHANSLQHLRPIDAGDSAPEPIQAGAWLHQRLKQLGL